MKISSRYKNIPENFRRYEMAASGLPEANNDLYGRHGSYQHQLLNKKWIEKREEILQRDGYQCRNCGKSKNLEVHHMQFHYIAGKNEYKAPWDYEADLLITLCKACNRQGRNKYKIPTKII